MRVPPPLAGDVPGGGGKRSRWMIADAMNVRMSDTFIALALALTAALFAAVGQAGGAGYVAVLAVAGQAPDAIRPAALLLTLLVAVIGTIHLYRQRLLRWGDVWPFALLGVPGAVAGGLMALPVSGYRFAVALLLLAAAAQMLRTARGAAGHDARALAAAPLLPALVCGGGVGLLAALTGIGGGIFIMPLVLSLGWATARRAAVLAQVNNVYTAAAGLLGVGLKAAMPAALPWWALAAAAGGLAGAWAGTRYLPPWALRLLLALVLLASGLKLLL
jgi:uncharacterized membrane protein YfcA